MASAPIAPDTRLASAPFRNRIIVGMLRMPNRPATSGRASVSTLATMRDPARLSASLASSGATVWQGARQPGPKSTSTGSADSRISSSNSLLYSTGMGFLNGTSGDLHEAQCALPFSRDGGTRLGLEQEGQVAITGTP